MREKLFFNGNIFIGKSMEMEKALAVRGDKVLFSGVKSDCESLLSAEYQLIDLQGKTVIPGFNDCHCHMVELGQQLNSKDLSSMNKWEIYDYLFENNQRGTSGNIKIGMGLKGEQFKQISEEGLDDAPENNPLILFHQTGHAALLNTAAVLSLDLFNNSDLKTFWYLEKGDKIKSAYILHEPYECPIILKLLQLNKKDEFQLSSNINSAISVYQNLGITSIQDNTWDQDIFRYISFMAKGISICCWSKGDDLISAWEMDNGVKLPQNVSSGPVKFFLDGAFTNKTAWLWEPYAGEDSWCGEGKSSREIVKMISPFIAANRQLAFHAIGDRSISELCDALEKLLPYYPKIPELRIRIEHAQLIRESDFERIRNLGMVISSQPPACCNPEKDIQLVGEKRASEAYPHKRIIEEEIPLGFGTDYPYEAYLNPLKGIHEVCNRTLGISITPEQALSVYTHGSAYLENKENTKGTLNPGMLADFSIINGNPIIDDISTIEVERIFVRGIEIPVHSMELAIPA